MTITEITSARESKAAALKARILDAETRGSQWLADGNEANEDGNLAKAALCYRKAQFWLDRRNLLEDRAIDAGGAL